jgi:phosphotransferase system enzyme I (PtsI)
VRIRTGDRLIVDGIGGGVFVNPAPAVERDYERVGAEIREAREALRDLIDVPAVTLDGERITLMANVTRIADTEAAVLYGAEGIGLYRTEFVFTAASRLPTEDEQHDILMRAAERMRPSRVVVRLLDIGGDKQLDYLPLPSARNPSLALRGIRLLLDRPDIVRPQIRAFLRATAHHPIAVLIPVVGGIEEVRRTRALIREVAAELAAEGVTCDPDVPVGAMIEVPSAALMAASIGREVDFLSLGTNDLVQYVLAADREDQGRAPYYQPLHPAVLRMIAHVIRAASESNRPLTICGEIAGDPAFTELLLGMGLRELSVAPGNLLPVKRAIREIRIDDAKTLADAAAAAHSVEEVEALLAARATGTPVGPPVRPVPSGRNV